MEEATPSLSIWRDIEAPAEVLFGFLIRPVHHLRIDGSGMLRGTDESRVISGVGDVFEMRMFNEILGDYVIKNHVVVFEPERLIAWEPVLKATDKAEYQWRIGDRAHVRWGWELAPHPDSGAVRVTEFYDLSRSPEWLHRLTSGGETWRSAMEASLVNLAGLVEQNR